jgi:hypothetical protein
VRELNYPGWTVSIDGNPAATTSTGVFREVPVSEGSHRVVWTYRPTSVRLGLIVSAVTLFFLAALAHVRFWHQAWLDRVLAAMKST